MGVMDVLAEDSDLVATVESVQAAIDQRHTTLPSIAEYEQMGYPAQFIDAAYSSDSPPAGIFGAGVVHLQDKLRPAVFIMLEMSSAPVEMLANDQPQTPAQRMVARYSDGPLPADLVIVGLPPIRNYCTVFSGGSITVGDERSTLGVPVALAGGQRGYITAGHGARTVGDSVLVDGKRIGTVVFSSCRELAPDRSRPVADVAVIGLDTEVLDAPSGAPRISRVNNPEPNVLVSRAYRGALRRGRVWGLSPEFSVDSYAPWAEVIMCSPISTPGDSGSAVLRNDDTTACIGHVVGGAEGYTTVVQQLQYQLDAAGVALRR